MADEENQATDNSPAEEAGDENKTEEAGTEDNAEDTSKETEDKAEDAEDNAEETEESDKEESDAPSEKDVPKGYHDNPKMQTYVKRQSDKAVAKAKEDWEADNKPKEESVPIVDKVAEAQSKLEKAYETGTAKDIAQAQVDLNNTQIDARVAKAGEASKERQATTDKIDAEIVSVKADLTDQGVKDVNDLDKYLPMVDKTQGVAKAYEFALDIREGKAKAKMSGEKVALKKSKSITPGKPSGESKSGIYKPGDSWDDIDKKTEHIT